MANGTFHAALGATNHPSTITSAPATPAARLHQRRGAAGFRGEGCGHPPGAAGHAVHLLQASTALYWWTAGRCVRRCSGAGHAFRKQAAAACASWPAHEWRRGCLYCHFALIISPCFPACREHEKRAPQVNGIEVSELEASAAQYTSKQASWGRKVGGGRGRLAGQLVLGEPSRLAIGVAHAVGDRLPIVAPAAECIHRTLTPLNCRRQRLQWARPAGRCCRRLRFARRAPRTMRAAMCTRCGASGRTSRSR